MFYMCMYISQHYRTVAFSHFEADSAHEASNKHISKITGDHNDRGDPMLTHFVKGGLHGLHRWRFSPELQPQPSTQILRASRYILIMSKEAESRIKAHHKSI